MKTPILDSHVRPVMPSAIVALIIFFNSALTVPAYAIESAPAVDEALLIRAEQWEAAREGERLLAMPALQRLVNAWDAQPGRKIELRYPGGEEGELWVEELKDWLVSLGVASGAMVVVPGSGQADIIRFQVIESPD